MKKFFATFITMVLILLMSLQSFAENFTPSATQKGAPGIVSFKVNGEVFAASIVTKDGSDIIVNIPAEHLIITPISESDTALYSIQVMLKVAYSSISSADSIAQVVPDFKDAVLNMDSSLDPDDFVIRDLFSISLDGEYSGYLNSDRCLLLTFNAGMSANSSFLVLQYSDNQWTVINPENVIPQGDGKVSVMLDSLGVLAFAVETNAIDENAPKSPDTSDFHNVIYTALFFAGSTAIIVTIFIFRKKQKFGEDNFG